jgi:hypothetical protein
MTMRPIKISDLEVGVPVRWDVYDARNILLLRKGVVLNSEKQLRILA